MTEWIKWPRHLSLSIEHNAHKGYYEYTADYLKRPHLEGSIKTKDYVDILEGDEIWECQIYPDTPIGFYTIVVPTWERLVEEINKLGE